MKSKDYQKVVLSKYESGDSANASVRPVVSIYQNHRVDQEQFERQRT